MTKDFNHLVSTFKSSIKTWDYFVNWNKVFANSTELEISLNKLNYLLGKDNLRDEFYKLYQSNPDIVKALPVLLAVREKKLEIYDKKTKESEFYNFAKPENDPEKYYEFLEKSGLARLFQRDGVKNLVDYVIGVEVGLDSNGRKNRGGSLMEEITGIFIEEFCKQNGFEYLPQARASAIRAKWDFEVKVDKSERSFDFAVYNPQSGNLNDELKAQSIDFIWVTDGLGWHTAKRPLEETFNHNDHVFNLDMLENDALNNLSW